MKILFAASEVAPFSKTGGLGDVAAALPAALARRGHRLLVLTPLYGCVNRTLHGLRPLGIEVGGASLHEAPATDGVRRVFIENEALFGRAGVYGEGGGEYPDNAARFAFFSRLLLPAAEALSFSDVDLLHLNDWQTGLAALELARGRGRRAGLTRSVFTIHNLGYQGVFPKELVDELKLGWDAFTPDGLEFYDQVNFLKAGLVFSDLLTTVSPTYATEIQGVEQGFGLDGVLRSRSDRLVGILNGVDHQGWDPSSDPAIAAAYDADAWAGKARCRQALCRELRLEPPPGTMVMGIVSRFASQKGFDLILEALPELVRRGISLAILGNGEGHFEHAFAKAAARHPGRIGLRIGFDEGLAHRIYAGCDAFLMPSLYEPCGLSQLYALRYGSPPIVRRTGGLADTVEEAGEGVGTGFLFDRFDSEALIEAADRALDVFASPERWQALARRGMAEDFSWEVSARAYEAAYQRALGRRAAKVVRS